MNHTKQNPISDFLRKTEQKFETFTQNFKKHSKNSSINHKGWYDSHWRTTEDLDDSTSSKKKKVCSQFHLLYPLNTNNTLNKHFDTIK